MFSQHADITKAIGFCSSFRLWIPHDCVELSMNNTVATLGESHPDIFEEWNVFRFPAGVPAPAPPSVFDYYNRIKSATGQEKMFWKSVVEFEYALIYMACWWHECERGQKAYILCQNTIDWIAQRLPGEYIVDGESFNSGREGTNVKYIIDRMQEARYASLQLRHIVHFPKTNMPPSYFVVSSRQTGHILYNVPAPLPWVKSYQNGRLFVDTKTLRNQGDPRVNKLDMFTYSIGNMWQHAFPIQLRSTCLLSVDKTMAEHQLKLHRSAGGCVKSLDMDLSDEELRPENDGDLNDITRFCCQAPRRQSPVNRSPTKTHNNMKTTTT